MLETSQERVKLLKAGISTRAIEQLYLQSNCFKIIGIPVLFNAFDIIQETRLKQFFSEVPITAFQTVDFSGARQ
jgi:hypothetical protein